MKNYYKKIVYLIIALSAALIINYYSCALLKFTDTPPQLTKNSRVVMLYSSRLCNSCREAGYVKELDKRSDILFILSSKDYKEIDAEKLQEAFDIKSRIVMSDESSNEFVSKLSTCLGRDVPEANYYLELDRENNYKVMQVF